jgi:phosphoglycolate phosphatase
MNNTVRLAVFDCDGTLVDSQHAIVAAMHASCDAHGFPRPAPEAVRRMVGLPLAEAFARLLPDIGADACERLRDSYKEVFFALRRGGHVSEPLYPGAREGLQALEDDGWLLGVATGKALRGLVATLEKHGLTERFVTLQTSDRAQGKPHPDMLLRAMAETGASGRGTVMIGDTTYDMEMARNADTLAVGVAWGYHGTGELRAAGAHTVVDDFAQLPGTIENLWEAKP